MKTSSSKLLAYEQKLLEGWEEVYKKGQLTLWILLALKDSEKHMAEVKQFIANATNGTLTADDQSMYRALRRYYDTELVTYRTIPGDGGPELKLYRLSAVGSNVLAAFLDRNIASVFYQPEIKTLIETS